MKSIVLYSIIGASAIAVGAGAGTVYKRCFVAPSEKIEGFDPNNCKPNAEELFKKVEKAGSVKNAVQQLKPFEIVNYAFEKYKACEYNVSFCTGMAKTIIDQEVRSAQIKRGTTYFEEQISKSSMVGVGKRMLQEGEKADTKIYNETGSADVYIEGTSVHTNFKSEFETVPYESYKEAWGRNLPDMSIYLIAESTVEKQEIAETDKGYKVTLELQPQKGAYNYRYQMKTISGLDDYPSFQFLNLTYELTKDLEMRAMTEKSKFHALMGVSVDIENTINYYYFPNEQSEIPEITEDFDYAKYTEKERQR